MFATKISEATALGAAVIIRETTSFAERQTSFKKTTFVYWTNVVFLLVTHTGIEPMIPP